MLTTALFAVGAAYRIGTVLFVVPVALLLLAAGSVTGGEDEAVHRGMRGDGRRPLRVNECGAPGRCGSAVHEPRPGSTRDQGPDSDGGRGVSVTATRKRMQCTGLLLSAAFLLATQFAATPAVALVLLGCAAVILYSLWILVVAAAFVVVKIDNLSFLFISIYDAARWPADVFRGVLRFVFTFLVPLAVMTTFPAEALLGRLAPGRAGAIALGALLFAACARVVWLRSIARYTSASS